MSRIGRRVLRQNDENCTSCLLLRCPATLYLWINALFTACALYWVVALTDAAASAHAHFCQWLRRAWACVYTAGRVGSRKCPLHAWVLRRLATPPDHCLAEPTRCPAIRSTHGCNFLLPTMAWQGIAAMSLQPLNNGAFARVRRNARCHDGE